MAQTDSPRGDGAIAALVQAAGAVIPALTHTAEGLVLVRGMIRDRPGCMGLLLFGVGYVLGRVAGPAKRHHDRGDGECVGPAVRSATFAAAADWSGNA